MTGVAVFARLVVAALLLCALPVGADPVTCFESGGGAGGGASAVNCVPPDRPPEGLDGSFDATIQTLTLTWSPADGTTPTSYIVYRDDMAWARPTDAAVDDDLTGFNGHHIYRVTAIYGTVESDLSLPFAISKYGTCVGTSTGYPYVIVHPDECP